MYSKLLAMFVIVICMASCGIFNKTKQSKSYGIEELSKRDCVVVEDITTSENVKEKTVDKGVVVTERTTKTTTTKKSGKGNITVDLDALKHGDNYLKDSAGNEVHAVLDTLSKTLKLNTPEREEKSTTEINERITENRDAKSDRESSSSADMGKKMEAITDNRREERQSEKETVRKPNVFAILGNWVGLAVMVVVVIGFLLWYFGVRGRK